MKTTKTKHLVLAGGGHTNALICQYLSMLPDLEIMVTLISDTTYAPYSGMVPGYLAGYYTYEDSHIDLVKLASKANINFVFGKITGIDPKHNKIMIQGRPPVSFDYLSINIGSKPLLSMISGADKFSIPSKPIPALIEGFQNIESRMISQSNKAEPKNPMTVIIIGAGASGFEMSLSLKKRYQNAVNVILLTREERPLSQHGKLTSKFASQILKKEHVKLYLGQEVLCISESHVITKIEKIAYDFAIVASRPAGYDWPKISGLKVNDLGFILVKDTLQTLDYPQIFAAGDCATLVNAPHTPKSGVYAVRQAEYLWKNIKNIMAGADLIAYAPQKKALALMGMPGKSTIYSRGILQFKSDYFWILKEYIDRKFMEKLAKSSPMQNEVSALDFTTLEKNPKYRCRGCASKMPGHVMQEVIARLRADFSEPANSKFNPLKLMDFSDDASLVTIDHGNYLFSVDHISSMVRDPFLFGEIATLHTLSDVFAKGTNAKFVQIALQLPYMANSMQVEVIYQVMSGVCSVLSQHAAYLVGGHTSEAEILAASISVCGTNSLKPLKKTSAKPGDLIILTKPLGTGLLFAADMRGQCKGAWMSQMISSILLSNQKAGNLLQSHASACTDVTGFGLLGHLAEMLSSGKIGATLFLNNIPLLNGAKDVVAQGVRSTLTNDNHKLVAKYLELGSNFISNDMLTILVDPQTSGGLLTTLPADSANTVLNELIRLGYLDARIIGIVNQSADVNINFRESN